MSILPSQMPKDPIAPPSWTSSDASPGSSSGSADTFPRWLSIAGFTAAAMLLLVLLRFAIDLLGLVLVMVLVGFSIRALSDWLSDDDTVSGWSLVAVALSLCGTIAIGTWLFDVKHMDASGAIQRRLPAFITRGIDWAEQRGWGQRVLLSDRALIRTPPPAAASPPASATPSLAIEIPPPAPTRPTGIRSKPRPASRETTAAPPAATGGSLPAGAPGTRSTRPANVPSGTATAHGATAIAAAQPAPAAAAPPPAAVRARTRTLLTTWPAAAIVGTSVRLTARVETDPGEQPALGSVIFRAGDRVLGTARLRRDEGGSSGFIVVLTLPVGEHVIVAEYGGDERYAPSRSAPVRQAVVRR